jgi:uncharacterized protein YjbJ (UPF0337 family)
MIGKGKWNQVRGEVKRRWNMLTDDELDQARGSLDKLVGLVQEKYGYSRDLARREVDQYFQRFGDSGAEFGYQAENALASVRGTFSRNPWMYGAAAALLAFVIVGFVWKPFETRSRTSFFKQARRFDFARRSRR